MDELQEKVDKFVEKLDNAPTGQILTDADSRNWHKESDGLWNGGNGFRMNSLALWAYCYVPEKQKKKEKDEPRGKLPKGLKETPQGLF